jgi:hypothetical protein
MGPDAIPTRSPPSPSQIAWTLFGLAAGPAGWIIELVTNYGLASYACFPRFEPWRRTPPPGWSAEPAILTSISIACLALTVSGILVSASCWRGARGRGAGREAFLAACGVMAALGFTLALLFDTWPLLRTPACWNVPS